MPAATLGIYTQLGLSGELSAIDPADLQWGSLPEGTKIGEVQPLFPRIDKKKTMDEIKKAVESPGAHTRQAESVSTASAQPPGVRNVSPTAETAPAAEAVTNFTDITDFANGELIV